LKLPIATKTLLKLKPLGKSDGENSIDKTIIGEQDSLFQL
jgi:hypothetical protein